MTELTPQEIVPEQAEQAPSRPERVPPGEEPAVFQPGPEGVPPREEAAVAEEAAALPTGGPLRQPLAMPAVPPPGPEGAVGEHLGAGWHSGKKIVALWSSNQNRNAWIGVSELGWRKLADNSDSVVLALTTLAAHARLTGGNVDIKENGGQITEIYAW